MKKRLAGRTAAALMLAFLLAPASHAALTFKQLDEDIFQVSHRVKIIGSRGKAMDMAMTKTASLCLAAGYSHLRILREDSEASQRDDSANASIRAQFFFADGEDRIECERNADPKYVEEASAKLVKEGYEAPDPSASPTPASAGATSASELKCTLEQIATMARSGLSDDQIRSACTAGG